MEGDANGRLSAWRAAKVASATKLMVPRVIACATMWHETRSEMREMLLSITRMDREHAIAARSGYSGGASGGQGRYQFSAHIFFDDAFEPAGDDDDDGDEFHNVNGFVKDLVSVVNEFGATVYKRAEGDDGMRIRPPRKIPTPYGGQYRYTLPGGTKMVVHLKDKSLIRHKKRWSQCMYMYYLLGHKIIDLYLPMDVRVAIADRTYLLALDGDIEFRSVAVDLLVDMLTANKTLGAACGRIHPVGLGPMAWYQIFEYAIGHWMQKETEHVFGSVVCAPGCFSLFRGRALMEDGVMRKYITTSEQPQHYVQYDQGEDRWLCTLLLQSGFRVEYCPVSDSYTHCPEGFGEFFNQRRRWVPSTMANIFDLIQDFWRVVGVNKSVGVYFMIYQLMLTFGTLIGPGTIFLMLVSGCEAAFHMTSWKALALNLPPIVTFTGVCKWFPAKYQIRFAKWLSLVYMLLTIGVILGVLLQVSQDGIASPTAIFLLITTGSLLCAAILHPKEFSCIFPFPIYLLAIPSMYLLLMIYSIMNLNVVSWGTRENVPAKTRDADRGGENGREGPEARKKKPLLNRRWITERSEVSKLLAGWLPDSETRFWNGLIGKYLHPIDSDREREALNAKLLRGLRNRCVGYFLGINVLYVVIIFILSINIDHVYIPWPFVANRKYTILAGSNQVAVETETLRVGPLGIVLVFFFGGIVSVQFAMMVVHRLITIVSVVLNFNKETADLRSRRKAELQWQNMEVTRHAVEFFGSVTSSAADEDLPPPQPPQARKCRKDPYAALRARREKQRRILEAAFKKRYFTPVKPKPDNLEGNAEGGGGDEGQLAEEEHAKLLKNLWEMYSKMRDGLRGSFRRSN